MNSEKRRLNVTCLLQRDDIAFPIDFHIQQVVHIAFIFNIPVILESGSELVIQ